MLRHTTTAIIATSVILTVSIAAADVKPTRMFGDYMVLQREMPVPVWGTADAGEKVSVAFRDQKQHTTADKDGKWMVKLDALKLGKPSDLTFSGNNTVTFKNVLVGDVWIGSGQSNMAGSAGGYAKRDSVLADMVKAAPYPQLRLYRGGWKEATESNIKGFSALLFSFGQPLQKELGVPVGLIVGAVGGTPSGRWLSPEMFADDAGVKAQLKRGGASASYEARTAKYQQMLKEWEAAAALAKKSGKKPPRKPRGPVKVGDLYAAHIQYVVPFAIRGVLWDQGESGTAVPEVDQFTMMGALIRGWRTAWGQGDFPFLYVQKMSGGGCAWDPKADPTTRMANAFTKQPANVNPDRDGEYRALHIKIMQHPNTAMVTASDLGSGVHPINKSGYGQRASRVALGFAYGKDVEIYGPVYDSHKVEGNQIRIAYTHVGKGLATRHSDALQGFEVAGKDGQYHWADAKIDGDTVVVSSDQVAGPVAVRYGWSKNRTWANLFNKNGLPALTFRSATATE